MKYKIQQVIVTSPEVDLPEGSVPVGVKHHDDYKTADGEYYKEAWQVKYLEPKA